MRNARLIGTLVAMMKQRGESVTQEQRAELRRLYTLARTVNGATPLGSPTRAAAVRLSALLAELHAAGVPLPVLDEACGARPGTSKRRLRRHGARRLPPSMATAEYKGVVASAPNSPIDITGETFGKLTALRPVGPSPQGTLWLCRCDCCGTEVVAPTSQLRAGLRKSCTKRLRWTTAELRLLARDDLSYQELAARLGRSEVALRSKRSKLNKRVGTMAIRKTTGSES